MAILGVSSVCNITPAYAGHSEIVSLFIDSGAKYKSAGRNGMSALHMAACKGQMDCCKLLLSKALIDTRMDFEIDTVDAEGRTCLHLAALSGKFIRLRLHLFYCIKIFATVL